MTGTERVFSIDGTARRLACDPKNPQFVQDPYALYARLHAEAPTVFWSDYGHWCLTGFDAVSQLLRDRRLGRQILHLTTREALGWPPPDPRLAHFDAVESHSLLSLEPPVHTRLRALITRAFVSRQVERLRPNIERLANGLIDRFEAKGEADLLLDYATPIPVITIADMLGVPVSMARQLVGWSHDMVAMYMFAPTGERVRAADKAAADFSAYVIDLISEKQRSPDDALVSYLLSVEVEGERLTPPEIVSTVILLLNAGHEATVHQTGNAIKAILESGRDPQGLFATPDGSAATVEEALRFDAPLHLFTRYALEDMVLFDSIPLKTGDMVGLMLGAANRDPGRFEKPDLFWPERPDQGLVSFGGGLHFCIGAPLARLEMEVGLRVLFTRLPGLRLSETPVYKDVYHFHGLERLRVEWPSK